MVGVGLAVAHSGSADQRGAPNQMRRVGEALGLAAPMVGVGLAVANSGSADQ